MGVRGDAIDTRRTCDEFGCQTVLSMYNDSDFCSIHQPMVVPRMRGRKAGE